MLPEGMIYLKNIQLETQRDLVHRHPEGQYGHRLKDRSLTGQSAHVSRCDI